MKQVLSKILFKLNNINNKYYDFDCHFMFNINEENSVRHQIHLLKITNEVYYWNHPNNNKIIDISTSIQKYVKQKITK